MSSPFSFLREVSGSFRHLLDGKVRSVGMVRGSRCEKGTDTTYPAMCQGVGVLVGEVVLSVLNRGEGVGDGSPQ